MNKLEQAARQALEALEVSTDWDVGAKGKQLQSMKAITALREALAEQAERNAKRYAYMMHPDFFQVCDSDSAQPYRVGIQPTVESGFQKPINQCIEGRGKTLEEAVDMALAEQAEQEPVAWLSEGGDVSRSKKFFDDMGFKSSPLYAAPVRKKDLTDDEVTKVWKSQGCFMGSPVAFARAVIAADREKNRG